MYEMYPWHRADAAADDARHPRPRGGGGTGAPARTATSRRAHPGGVPAARALQVALDRSDNGGEAAAERAE